MHEINCIRCVHAYVSTRPTRSDAEYIMYEYSIYCLCYSPIQHFAHRHLLMRSKSNSSKPGADMSSSRPGARESIAHQHTDATLSRKIELQSGTILVQSSRCALYMYVKWKRGKAIVIEPRCENLNFFSPPLPGLGQESIGMARGETIDCYPLSLAI